MAIPWLTVLQSVPWTDVIRNAPKVADGAKKLWQTVARRTPTRATATTATATPLAQASDAARIAALEDTVADLHAQMLASSELLKALAEQNTQLIGRVAWLQRQVRRLGAGAAVLAVAGLAVMVLR
ncbi:MAG: hypothetical protein ABI574_08600 [Burkholderiales bacterium]